MKIEPSGVVMIGRCNIRTEACTAKNVGPVTAIWSGNNQIDVCRECLDEKIRLDEWQIEGAKILPGKINVEIVTEKDVNAGIILKAVAKNDKNDILMIETLEIPYSGRKKFGDEFLKKDLEISIKTYAQKYLTTAD
ncbi:hypothetical protein QUF90_24540 [Desulfococcaceae bacterium HSG9]|nr:hypothetical protein [Desulfococcaceae bacterium HSG9]